jgi:hypothetical protein
MTPAEFKAWIKSPAGPGSYRATAEAFGISQRTIKRWIAGDYEIPPWILFAIAGYELSLDDSDSKPS